MIKETIKIKLDDNYKEKALTLIDDTIQKVSELNNSVLSDKDKRTIRNLTLDQVNVNVSQKASCKTLWVFSIESSLSVLVEREESVPRLGALVPGEKEIGSYQMKPNLTWTLSKSNDKNEGLNRKSFEEMSLEMLLEDIETAAFYGALSYVGDVNEY